MKRQSPVFILLFLIPSFLFAQNKISRSDDVKVYINCNTWCDMNFIKTEINYVDFMPDQFLANLFIMITSQTTGSGGREINLFFKGRKILKVKMTP